MTMLAKKMANNASFQAFINCYLREIDTGVFHLRDKWLQKNNLDLSDKNIYVLELQLESLNTTLALGISYYSLAGRHVVIEVYEKKNNQWHWQKSDYLSTIILLINNIYDDNVQESNNTQNTYKLELLSRTLESHQVMQDYAIARFNDPSLAANSFIESEQSILFGHWLHPTPKSRQGIHHWQHQHYTPELTAQFQLHFFAAKHELIRQNSVLEHSAADIVNLIAQTNSNSSMLTQLGDDMQLLPVHPLQAQWLLHQDYIQALIQQGKLQEIGQMGLTFTPTSSVRTLYCKQLDFMIKVSIPVKITNSLRSNMEHELDAGLYMGNLLRNHDFSTLIPKFSTVDDPAYMTLTLPDQVESGFEIIIRENPFNQANNKDQKVISIAALVQEPLNPSNQSRLSDLISTVASKQNISKQKASSIWFDAYWECSIASAIKLYDSYGIALEAHQQNSLLDISEGIPNRYYYRDNQGFYLSKSLQKQLLKMEPNLNKTLDLFYDDKVICDRFSYYLFINQLFSIVHRFGQDGLLSEEELLIRIHHKLQDLLLQLNSVGKALITSILKRRDIPCKGNLLTRINDVDELQADQELAVYTAIKNPLFNLSTSAKELKNNIKEAYLESA